MIRRIFIAYLATAFCLQAAPPAAEICFFDDFQQYPIGDLPKKLGPWTLNRKDGVQWSVEIAKDRQDAFGRSSDNQFLRFSSNVDKGPILTAEEVISNRNVITISFSAILQAGEWPLHIYIGRGQASGDSLSMLASISQQETSGPVVHRFDVVFNHSADPVSYGSEGHSLDARSMDVWRDGVLIVGAAKSPGKLPVEESLDSFVFRTSSGGNGKPLEAWIDWVAVFNGAVVGGDTSSATATHHIP